MADDVQKEEEVSQDAPTETEEPKKEEGNEGGIDESVEVPEEFASLIEKIEEMPVLKLNELVKVLEKRFGVSAQAAVAAGPASGGDAGSEQDSFTVELADAGSAKIQVIKAVKEALGLGLKEAKDLVDGAPAVLKEDVKKEDAEALKAKIEEAGGKVNLK